MDYEKYELLRKQANVTNYRVAKDTGLDTGTFSHWKRGDYEPKFDKLKKIADYFGVSTDYFDDSNNEEVHARLQMRDEVRALADLATKADPEQVKMATAFLKTIMKSK